MTIQGPLQSIPLFPSVFPTGLVTFKIFKCFGLIQVFLCLPGWRFPAGPRRWPCSSPAQGIPTPPPPAQSPRSSLGAPLPRQSFPGKTLTENLWQHGLWPGRKQQADTKTPTRPISISAKCQGWREEEGPGVCFHSHGVAQEPRPHVRPSPRQPLSPSANEPQSHPTGRMSHSSASSLSTQTHPAEPPSLEPGMPAGQGLSRLHSTSDVPRLCR